MQRWRFVIALAAIVALATTTILTPWMAHASLTAVSSAVPDANKARVGGQYMQMPCDMHGPLHGAGDSAFDRPCCMAACAANEAAVAPAPGLIPEIGYYKTLYPPIGGVDPAPQFRLERPPKFGL